MHQATLVLLLIFCCGATPPLQAEETQAGSGTLSIVLENDVFNDIDRHYTNGLKIVWVPGQQALSPAWATKLARVLPWFPDDVDVHPGYAAGQSMFTPSDIKTANPPLDQRPYAGWLYATVGLAEGNGKQLDLFSITVGMVGPSSLAEDSQEVLHTVIDANEPRGWDTQLNDEAGIVITSQRYWRGLARTTLSGNHIDFTPHAGIALGNVFTYANTGLTLRYGATLPHDFGPPRVQPGLPSSGEFSPTSDFGWYLYCGVEGRAVAHNIFLDGNTFRDSRRVDRESTVGDLHAGLVLNWRDIRISYAYVTRSREFRTQSEDDDFGVLSLSFSQ